MDNAAALIKQMFAPKKFTFLIEPSRAHCISKAAARKKHLPDDWSPPTESQSETGGEAASRRKAADTGTLWDMK